MDDYGNQDYSNEKAQWAKIDDCASGISDLRELIDADGLIIGMIRVDGEWQELH